MDDVQVRQGRWIFGATLALVLAALTLIAVWMAKASDLRGQVDAHAQELASLRRALGADRPDAEELQRIKSRVGEADGRLGTLEAGVGELRTRLEGLKKAEPAPLPPGIAEAPDQLKGLGKRLDALEVGFKGLTPPPLVDLAPVSQRINALERRVSALEGRPEPAGGALPVGSVVAWLPTSAGQRPPPGWEFADELDGRFLLGVGDPQNVGRRGGGSRVKLPAHFCHRSSDFGQPGPLTIDGQTYHEMAVQPLLSNHTGRYPILTMWPQRADSGWVDVPLPPHVLVRFIRRTG